MSLVGGLKVSEAWKKYGVKEWGYKVLEKVSVNKPGDIHSIDIFEVFNGIRTGVILGQDLKPITKQIQSLSDHSKQNELKKKLLGVLGSCLAWLRVEW